MQREKPYFEVIPNCLRKFPEIVEPILGLVFAVNQNQPLRSPWSPPPPPPTSPPPSRHHRRPLLHRRSRAQGRPASWLPQFVAEYGAPVHCAFKGNVELLARQIASLSKLVSWLRNKGTTMKKSLIALAAVATLIVSTASPALAWRGGWGPGLGIGL